MGDSILVSSIDRLCLFYHKVKEILIEQWKFAECLEKLHKLECVEIF